KDKIIGQLHKGLSGLIGQAGIEVVTGRGSLVDAHTVSVESAEGIREVTGTTVVLATGSYAKTIPGIELGPRVMTSDQAMDLTEIPQRVAVLGGGVIGVEFASMLRSFGAEVTIVEALERIVAAEEPAISK